MSSESLRNFTAIGRKIVAVGRNYRGHIAEMKATLPTKPLLFLKPTSAYIQQGEKIRIPPGCENLQHELELGVVISAKATRLTQANAMNFVGGYTLALDMTARDIQEAAKKAGNPWTIAKGFDTSCPVGPFIPKEIISDPHQLELSLTVNGVEKQRGRTDAMIFSLPVLLEFITQFITLEPGDLVLTGTPEGVSTLKSNDVIQAQLADFQGKVLTDMTFQIE